MVIVDPFRIGQSLFFSIENFRVYTLVRIFGLMVFKLQVYSSKFVSCRMVICYGKLDGSVNNFGVDNLGCGFERTCDG